MHHSQLPTYMGAGTLSANRPVATAGQPSLHTPMSTRPMMPPPAGTPTPFRPLTMPPPDSLPKSSSAQDDYDMDG
jgi:hypothetical protein